MLVVKAVMMLAKVLVMMRELVLDKKYTEHLCVYEPLANVVEYILLMLRMNCLCLRFYKQ